jgi:hypothetical protein
MGIVYRVRCHKILIYLPIELHRFDSCQRPKVAFFEAVNSWLGLINVYKFTTLDNFHLQRPKPFVYNITDSTTLKFFAMEIFSGCEIRMVAAAHE